MAGNDVTSGEQELYDVTVDEISLVDRGANQSSAVILFKNDNTPEDNIMDPISQEEAEKLAQDLAKANQTLTDLTAALEAKTAEADKLAKRETELTNEVAALKKSANEPGDDIEKMDVSESVKKMLRDQNARIAAAETIAKKMAEENAQAQIVLKLAPLDKLTTTAEKLAPIMYRVSKGLSTQADADEIERILKSANEGLKAKGVKNHEEQIGKNGGGEGSALSELNTKAAEIRKSDSKISKEQAFTKALGENPDLYQRYIEESA